jgi:hypothetical protein
MKSNSGLGIPSGPANGAKRQKQWQGTTARALQGVYSGAHPPSLFISKVRELYNELRIDGPPFDPWTVASHLNIEVKEESMALDGYVERRDDETFAIYLRNGVSLARKRFTLCHEIAHTFFFDILEDRRRYRQPGQDDQEEEQLCDIAAAEMLMPYGPFSHDLGEARRGGGPTPADVLRLMHRYGVSLPAVGARVTWISRDITCVLWEKRGPAINLAWASPSSDRSLVLCQTGRTSVEDAAANPGNEFTSRDSFYVMGDTTRLVRRLTSSRRLPSGQILSVLRPIRIGSERQDRSVMHESKPTKRPGTPARAVQTQFTFS